MSIWLSASFALSARPQIPIFQTSADLARIATNPASGSDERNRALSSLARMDFRKAMEIAPSLLAEGDRLLRVQAAWILADGGRQSGLDVLRAMSQEMTAESVIAMEMLGRIRDPGSHDLLAALLEQELASPRKGGSLFGAPSSDSWISALSGALADYDDPRDTPLLLRTVPDRVGSGHWVMVEWIGRAGGREAIPVLERIFDTARGWTVMTAGLGLARCGSPKGLKYVQERLADTSVNEDRQLNAKTDDPDGPKARDFILRLLGSSTDVVFVPDLLRIVSTAESPWVARARAWEALSRINPVRERQQLLALAWKNLNLTSAVRLVVLNDEARARRVAPGLPNSSDRIERQGAYELKRALLTNPRARRRWRETHGYTF